jgi:8-oxo-dGTP pyrophosphatase MutT (NUDIX family)
MKKNNKVNGAGVVVVSRDLRKVLTLWKGSKMDLPKGAIERGESTIAAAFREASEEIGLNRSECELISDVPYIFENIAFYYVFWDGTPRINANPTSGIVEHDKFMWMTWRKAIDSSPEFLKPALFHGLALKAVMPWGEK